MRWIVSLCLMLFTSTLYAQEDMSFCDAVDVMMSNNRKISSARYVVDAAYGEYRATQGLRAPQVEVVSSYTIMQDNVDIDLGGTKGVVTNSLEELINKGIGSGLISPSIAMLLGEGLQPIKDADWNYTLQKRNFGFVGSVVTMPIYMGGRINIANRVAKLNIEGANNALEGVENSLITELIKRYYGVVLADEVVKVRAFVVEGAKQHLSDALAMEEEGILPHSAILYLEYKLSEVERDYGDAQNQLHVAKLALETTLHSVDSITPIDRMFVVPSIPDIDYFRESALRRNSIICEAMLAKSLSTEGVNMARSELLPEVVAMGGASIYSHNLSDMIPRWAVGIGVSVPLFGGFSRQQQLNAAQAKSRSVNEIVESAKDDILLLVDKEYYTLNNELLNIQSCERSISFAESYYETVSEGFREGVSASSDLMDARIALAGAKVEYLNAVYNYMLSLARLLEVAGLSSEFEVYKSHSNIVDINSVIL